MGNEKTGKPMKYVIIGCSAAGINAATAIRKHDPTGEILLLTREDAGHYSRPMLSYYVAGTIKDEEVLYRGTDTIDQLGATLLKSREVRQVAPDAHLVHCADGSSYEYDQLLVASGGIAKQPDVPGITLPGVFHFRTLSDARAIRQWASRTNRCVSMGGGLVSLKAAEALRKIGVDEVYLVVGSNRVMSQALDQDGAGVLQRRLERHGVFSRTGESIKHIHPSDSDGTVCGVSFRSGEEMPCEMILVGKGVRPDLSLLEGSGVETDWGVLVDNRMHTNVPNIYAAGDVAQAFDTIHGENYVNALWPLAAQQGWVAGANMAKTDALYPGWFGMNSLQVFGLPVITMGLVTAEEDDAGLEVLRFLDKKREIYRKLVLRDGQLVGCAAVGNTDAAYLAGLIRAGTDVSDVKHELIRHGLYDIKAVPVGVGIGTEPRADVPFQSIVVDAERCLQCGSCELACSLAHSDGDWLAARPEDQPLRRIHLKRRGGKYVPTSCQHCADAPCVYACIAGVRQRGDNGIVTSEDLCVGCGSCYMVCPTGAINRDAVTGRYASCDRCGNGQPQCVEACPTHALRLVDGEVDAGIHFKIQDTDSEVN